MIGVACATGDSGGGVLPEPDGNEGRDGGFAGDSGLPPKDSTVIELPSQSKFPLRDCSLTMRVNVPAGTVKVAGEFTNWGSGAIDMKRAVDGNGFEVTLTPSIDLQGGILYGYKLLIDSRLDKDNNLIGEWRVDPDSKYRKIIDGVMNSALMMPNCEAGPELKADKLVITNKGNVADVKARIYVRAASDGSPPATVSVSLDNQKLSPDTWKTDEAAGALDFTFPSLPKGKHTFRVRLADKLGRDAEPLDLPFWVEDEPFSYRDGLLYMFMIDRFANGNKSNDRPVDKSSYNIHYDADWHGGDLEGALKVLETGYFDKLGVRTIWLSPANEQTSKGEGLFSAYHGYWPTKARSIEPRFGGDAGLRNFVTAAHNRGIRVLLDLINNQVHNDHEYLKDHADWFRTKDQSCKCGRDDIGCGWSRRPFDCLFQDYLPDIKWTNLEAERRFIDDAAFWISEYDLDGFRVDAVKHVEANSIFNMRAELSRRFEQGGARIFMVGETAIGKDEKYDFFEERFANGYQWIDAYTGPNGLDGQFDFPTRNDVADGLVSGVIPVKEDEWKPFPLRYFEGSLSWAERQYKAESLHVRFLNGHDNPRIASLAARDYFKVSGKSAKI